MSDAAFKRIAKLFPMLSSPNDGEKLNAVRAILKVLSGEKIHITELSKRIASGAPKAEDPPFEGGRKSNAYAEDMARERAQKAKSEWYQGQRTQQQRDEPRRKPSAWAQDKMDVEKVHTRMQHGGLDDWSEEFMDSVLDQVVHQGRALTDKQRAKLNEIMDKLGL